VLFSAFLHNWLPLDRTLSHFKAFCSLSHTRILIYLIIIILPTLTNTKCFRPLTFYTEAFLYKVLASVACAVCLNPPSYIYIRNTCQRTQITKLFITHHSPSCRFISQVHFSGYQKIFWDILILYFPLRKQDHDTRPHNATSKIMFFYFCTRDWIWTASSCTEVILIRHYFFQMFEM
jgi:hypothetical protein